MEKFDPFTENWHKWPEPVVRFFFSQAEAKLKQTIEAGRKITDRADSLLGTTVAFFLILLGYWVKSIVEKAAFSFLIFIAGFASLVMFGVIVLLMRLLFPRKVMPIGRDPRELVNDDFLVQGYEDTQLTIAIILRECQSYQECIEFNENDNNQRLRLLKIALYSLILILPVLGLSAVLYHWLGAWAMEWSYHRFR